MSEIYTFKRVEKKYILSFEQYKRMKERLSPFFHADEHGSTRIHNIYFDNSANELINTSLQKPVYKEKLRLRSYKEATDNTKVFLEIKKKFKGVVYKRRILLKYKDMKTYLQTGKLTDVKDPHTLSEIEYMIKHYSLYPKVYISYLRDAFFSNDDPNLRVTFDHSIKSRYEDLSLNESDKDEALFEKDDRYIMEIKCANAMPLFLSRILADEKIYPSSFSKYGNIHQKQYIGG